jgi:ribonucleoside-diphosphate reductase alpha chain
MYLETRDLGDMMEIYSEAWNLGVKTTYYLHMKPRHTAEQSTVKVNKAEDINAGAAASTSAPKKGFGFASGTTTPEPQTVSATTAAEPAVAAPARKGFGFGAAATPSDS